jgi:hypothetical protein
VVGANEDDVRQYLSAIGMGSPLVERTETVLRTVTSYLPEEPKYIFVSDYRDEEGNRNYESLWVLTETFMSEAKQFVTQGNFDIVRNDSGISRVVVDYDEFDFDAPREGSRLNVDVTFAAAGVSGSFRASGSNCADLQQVLDGYLLPLLVSKDG